MRLLVFEFITGGGLIGAPLPPLLLREGGMMRDALLADVADFSEVAVSLTRDPRCAWPLSNGAMKRIEPHIDENGMTLYQRALADVDVVWPIAPESDHALAQLAALARTAGKMVMLSDAATLAICASKYATARVLRAAGVNVVPTFRESDPLASWPGPWLSKRDVGAGGEGMRLWPNRSAALQVLCSDSQYPCVIQPWCPGENLSLSLFCGNGAALLLAVNRQHVSWHHNGVVLDGLSVNALPRESEDFQALARQIAQALPGLWGYIGVDVIRSEAGALTVLEINPRLTTSYCGLRDALGINVAKLALQQMQDDVPRVLECTRDRAVQLDFSIAHA